MPAHIEWLDPKYKIGIVRCGQSLFKFGDPYEFTFVLCLENKTATLIAGVGRINKTARTEILKELSKCDDIDFITWDRIRKDGSIHKVDPINLDHWRCK